MRFYPDPSVNYEYPENYYMTFGVDYVPLLHVQAAYEYARNHKWYMDARMVTTNDLYSFDPNVHVEIEEFTDIIGRNFRQPKEGLTERVTNKIAYPSTKRFFVPTFANEVYCLERIDR